MSEQPRIKTYAELGMIVSFITLLMLWASR
jgi:hypothetical protein